MRSELLPVRIPDENSIQRSLFLCTGNSARSIMAEAIMRKKGMPNFRAYSAGSHPAGRVHPEALRQIEMTKLPSDGLRSKSWDEFARPGAPQQDFVFTVCDNAAREVCPVWPGQPMTAHWGVADPASVAGTPEQIARAFRDAFMILERRINLFLSLPLFSLNKMAIKKKLTRLGNNNDGKRLSSGCCRSFLGPCSWLPP
jgi:arsenate reductase